MQHCDVPEEKKDKSKSEVTQNEKLRKLLSESDLASDNTSATPTTGGKPDSEYLDNRPPHHG